VVPTEIPVTAMAYLEIDGVCPICERSAHFRANEEWLRDSFLCDNCGSIPRERAFFSVIEMMYPNWRELKIHETSPAMRAASLKLKTECQGYSYSHYNERLVPGSVHPKEGYGCENIERMTFGSESFDLFLSQDVFEHIFHPDRAINEIERVLKPRGAHIMTVPIVMKSVGSQRRASIDPAGKVTHLREAQFHGNPLDERGSLVTIDWGYDLLDYLSSHSSLRCSMFYIDDLSRGIRAEFIEVVVCRKGVVPYL
jgi:SAM-dependent methyltransferase